MTGDQVFAFTFSCDSSRSELLEIIKRMAASNGLGAVILGCTELPLLVAKADDCRQLDSIDIHIDAGVGRLSG